MADEPHWIDELTSALPGEHRVLVEGVAPESNEFTRWLDRGVIATLGAHVAIIAAIYFWAHADAKYLLLPWLVLVVPALLAKTTWRLRRLWFSPNLGPFATVVLLGWAAFAPPAVVLVFYVVSIPGFALLEGERRHNPWSTGTYYLYSSIIFCLFNQQYPSLPWVALAFALTLGYALFRRRWILLACATGAAILIAVLVMDNSQGDKPWEILVLLLAAVTGAIIFGARRGATSVSDLARFVGGGLAVIGLAALAAFFDWEPLVWALLVTVLEFILVMRDPPSLPRVVWIAIAWQWVVWLEIQPADIRPLLSLLVCAALAYLGSVRSRRFLQVAAVLIGGIAAGCALSKDTEMAFAYLLTGIGFAVLCLSAGMTYAPPSATPWWHGLIPEKIFRPVVHFGRVSLAHLARAPVLSAVLALVMIPFSWIRAGKGQPGAFTLASGTVLVGNIVGATITARQIAFLLAGNTLFADVGALITGVVWVIWGATLATWASARGNVFLTVAGIVFIFWFVVYDLVLAHVLEGEMLALAIAFSGAGLWFSGLAAMHKLRPRAAAPAPQEKAASA